MGDSCVAIFWPTPGFKGRTFVSSGFSVEETLISVSTVPPPSPTLPVGISTTTSNFVVQPDLLMKSVCVGMQKSKTEKKKIIVWQICHATYIVLCHVNLFSHQFPAVPHSSWLGLGKPRGVTVKQLALLVLENNLCCNLLSGWELSQFDCAFIYDTPWGKGVGGGGEVGRAGVLRWK